MAAESTKSLCKKRFLPTHPDGHKRDYMRQILTKILPAAQEASSCKKTMPTDRERPQFILLGGPEDRLAQRQMHALSLCVYLSCPHITADPTTLASTTLTVTCHYGSMGHRGQCVLLLLSTATGLSVYVVEGRWVRR